MRRLSNDENCPRNAKQRCVGGSGKLSTITGGVVGLGKARGDS